jgi:hypothetical protein
LFLFGLKTTLLVQYRSQLSALLLISVMQTAWRERNPQARIKAAHEAMEKNPE